MYCIILSTEHLNLLDTQELDLDFNELIFSKDNNTALIWWEGETPRCIDNIINLHSYQIYTQEESMAVTKGMF